VDVGQIIELVAPLDAGPKIVDDLARGAMQAIKVILQP
jgi:hypothetical protein